MRRIAILPARGGSQRIPRKNIRPFRGKPIIQYPVELSWSSKLFDEVVVSTDDDEIAELALHRLSCSVFRREPDNGARGTQDVAKEVLMSSAYRSVTHACVIYPCSPLLVAADLERGWAVLQRDLALFAMSVSTDPLADAGCFYWGVADAWRVDAPLIDSHTVLVPMPARRVCDINTEDDWRRAEDMFDWLRRPPSERY